MDVSGYDFSGSFEAPNQVSQNALGIYLVVCMDINQPHCILDIGTAEGRNGNTVTSTGNLRNRLKTHGRSDCWKDNAHGEIAFYTMHISNAEERNAIEDELRWKFDPPCGSNPWDSEITVWDKYAEFKKEFGEQGTHELS